MMPSDPAAVARTRAQILIERRRPDEALRELHRALAEDPNDAMLHGLVAVCHLQAERPDEALQAARRCIGGAPDDPFGHELVARALIESNDVRGAETAIRQALELDPNRPDTWSTLARIQLHRREAKAALTSVERGLAVDPEHADCLSTRGLVLATLGRRDEAARSHAASLGQEPENAHAFATRGWSRLHAGDVTGAAEDFGAALRLEPDFEWARQGMIQTLRARYRIYRWLLAYFMWTSRLGSKASWGVVILSWMGFRALRMTSQEHPEYRAVLVPLLIVAGLAILLTWLGTAVFDSLLRLSRDGRLVLGPRERLASNVLLGTLTVAASFGLAVWLVPLPNLVMAAVGCAILVVPATYTAGADPETLGWRRWIPFAMAGALGLLVTGELVASDGLSALGLLGVVGGFIVFQLASLRAVISR